MRQALVLGAALAAAGGGAAANEAVLREGFVAGCLAGLPDFRGTEAALAGRGWAVHPGADPNEREFGKDGVAGFVRWGGIEASPGCTVMSPAVPRPAARRMIEEQLDGGFTGRWGEGIFGPDSWRVPGEGAALHIILGGTGNSGDGPGSGIGMDIRRD